MDLRFLWLLHFAIVSVLRTFRCVVRLSDNLNRLRRTCVWSHDGVAAVPLCRRTVPELRSSRRCLALDTDVEFAGSLA